MSDDMLREAASALRDETAGASPSADATRARIVAAVKRERSRRVEVVRAAVVLVAAVVGSTAWAAATGRLPSIREIVPSMKGSEVARELAAQASAERAAPSSDEVPDEKDEPVAAQVADDPAPEAPVVPREEPLPPIARAEEPAKTPREPAVVATARPAPAPPVATAATAPSAEPERDAPKAATADPPKSETPDGDAAVQALYTRAHTLHFQSRDYAGARTAWDAYLKAAPNGRFATLATYNRAICLVRLGQTAQAKKALAPFAEGRFGGYRRAEARSLIEALDAPAP